MLKGFAYESVASPCVSFMCVIHAKLLLVFEYNLSFNQCAETDPFVPLKDKGIHSVCGS